MRKLVFLICALAMPCASGAQSNQASWGNLSTIPPGQKIQVVDMNSKKVSGTFMNASDAAISLRDQSGAQTIQRQDVRSVELMKHANRLRNSLIGAGVGAGAGAGIVAGMWENRGFLGGKGIGAAVGAAFGCMGGAVVGALWPDHKTIYRVAAR